MTAESVIWMPGTGPGPLAPPARRLAPRLPGAWPEHSLTVKRGTRSRALQADSRHCRPGFPGRLEAALSGRPPSQARAFQASYPGSGVRTGRRAVTAPALAQAAMRRLRRVRLTSVRTAALLGRVGNGGRGAFIGASARAPTAGPGRQHRVDVFPRIQGTRRRAGRAARD